MAASTTESTMVKLTSGLAAATVGDRVAEQEAVALHEAVAVVDEALDALGAVAVAGRGRLLERDAEVGRRLLERRAGGVVERLVAATGDVVGHADDGIALAGGGVAAVSAGAALSAGAGVGWGFGTGRGLGTGRGFGAGRRLGPAWCRPVRRSTLSSSLPQAAAVKPSAAIDAERKNSLALDHGLPFRDVSGVIRQMFTVIRKATKR